MNNKEIHYEGWLIKSPPTKRIWRARWRRRWFTLKQGEIPEQFCLEYYTDRNCRKLKGVIDLDQCEQVDCGLRLENRKQKFQYMFDIKTPKRTYYLAADTEADMRDWVNCICQVCHLHDTKQSNDLQDENRTQHSSSGGLTNSTQNTTTTSLHSSSSGIVSVATRNVNVAYAPPASDILRRPTASVIDQQPTMTNQQQVAGSCNTVGQPNNQSNSDSVYVNTDYTNRETMLCDGYFDQQHLLSAAQQQPPPSPATALYLNHSALIQAQVAAENARLAVNSNGVVRKIPENLVLNNQTLPDSQSQSVQASPALSTASGPYIPISECFSGSPKFLPDGGGTNPTTPLNNLDPKFYDTPRSHNNIGLNLTNDQSYSPKITNCSLQQLNNAATAKNRSQRSDSDSESVFTDDDEWTHPMPLRENVDRNTRPSDSSIENESFVLTYSQRFSKMPDESGCKAGALAPSTDAANVMSAAGGASAKAELQSGHTLERLQVKVLKNKNNLILDFKENEKITRDLPQLSDTENTSPAIGPLNADSVVDESYDIPRSHQMPYHNMGQLLEKITSPHTNPIAASTPNLMAGLDAAAGSVAASNCGTPSTGGHTVTTSSPSSVRTLPRQHCYTNAAPNKVEGNVFRYDFIEQRDSPPVNRLLKPKNAQMEDKSPKVISGEDKPPEEFPAKPPTVDSLACKFSSAQLQSQLTPGSDGAPMRPPTVDRNCKPNAYKIGSAATMSQATRRSAGTPLSMVLPHETEGAVGGIGVMETRTLPRQPRPNYAVGNPNSPQSPALAIQHQRTASAAAAMQVSAAAAAAVPVPLPPKQNEHTLQYFDLDVTNKPPLNRQSMSVGNLLNTSNVANNQFVAPVSRAPQVSGVVYNFVDFVKTEAFKRIREERKKESECGVNNANTK